MIKNTIIRKIGLTLISAFALIFLAPMHVLGVTEYNYGYTGDVQTFVAPTDGIYKLEAWGASGGYRGAASNISNAGKGGYTRGNIHLNQGDVLYIYVGGSGMTPTLDGTKKGYNGGGRAPGDNIYGGGATDFRIDGTTLYHRIVVAAGGGSVGAPGNAGGHGGLVGTNATYGSGDGGTGASQTAGGNGRGSFGYGGDGIFERADRGGGGGGGWYGGGGGNTNRSNSDNDKGGGGGSAFVLTANTTNVTPVDYKVTSSRYLTSPAYSTGTNTGDGKAKITPVATDGILSIKLNNGNVKLDYRYDLYTYTTTVDNSVDKVTFDIGMKSGYMLSQTNSVIDLTDNTHGNNVITVTDMSNGTINSYSVTINKVDYYKIQNGTNIQYEIPYTGEYQEFYIQTAGLYTLELWGAKGGDRNGNGYGGNGGYIRGDVYLEKGEKLYLYVGGAGNTTTLDGTRRGWNGGGYEYYYYAQGGIYTAPRSAFGGGATDIRIGGTSLYNRLIVAGGGGSVGAPGNPGGGAGVAATTGSGGDSTPGSLTSGGLGASFGVGGQQYMYWNGSTLQGDTGGAGGGGWYGGGYGPTNRGGGSSDNDKGGAGGSNFALQASNFSSMPAGYQLDSQYFMTDVHVYNGNQTFKSPTGASETGHPGNGYIRITPKAINGFKSILLNNGDIKFDFDHTKHVYILTVSNDVPEVTIKANIASGYTLTQTHKVIDLTNNTSGTDVLTLVNNETGVIYTYSIEIRKTDFYKVEKDGKVYYDIPYTGTYQDFYIPATGTYTMSLWGAEGGYRSNRVAGRGGLVEADVDFSKNQRLYLYVGGSGQTFDLYNTTKGWNGGGKAYSYYNSNGDLVTPVGVYGGGATDIRIGGNTLYHRLIVAGGGGGVGCPSCAGGGAGISAPATNGSGGTAGTLTAGGTYSGTFGQGGPQQVNDNVKDIAGPGGGGWYGGGGAMTNNGNSDNDRGGGGGSNFALQESNYASMPAGYKVSDKFFTTNVHIYNGDQNLPSPTGTTENGHYGNGYIRLTPKYLNGVDSIYISADGNDVPFEFDYTKYDYTITIPDTTKKVKVTVIPASEFSMEESTTLALDYTDPTVKSRSYSVTITSNTTGLARTYNFTINKQSFYVQDNGDGSYGYTCTKDIQTFVAPAAGIYTLETWGAQGGNRNDNNVAGKGAYATGKIFLNKGQKIYVVVGCSGNNGGYNGGGEANFTINSNNNKVYNTNTFGGGATDIRIGGNTLYNRVLVAAGGGSVGCPSCAGGAGGISAVGNNGDGGTAGTLTAGGYYGGTFGQGAMQQKYGNDHGGAGGGGWYGGGSGNTNHANSDNDRGGGGGSSFAWTADMTSIVPAGYLPTSSHYLTETQIINGNATMPVHNAKTGTMVGKGGDGFARITFSMSFNYKIEVSDNVTLDSEFDYDTPVYNGEFNDDSSSVTFNVNLDGDESVALIEGDDEVPMHVGNNTHNIILTYINGAIATYTYNINRTANDIDYLNGITFDEKSINEFSNTDFDKDTLSYSVNLPYTMNEYDLRLNLGSTDQGILVKTLNDNKEYTLDREGKIHISNTDASYDMEIHVTNETNTSTKVYRVHVEVPHSSKMKYLNLTSSAGTNIRYEIVDGKTNYNLDLESYIAAVYAKATLYDSEATATITGDGYILSERFTIKVVVTEPHVDPTTYTFNISRVQISGYEKGYEYNGSYQTLIIPTSHEYKLEAWGAQGGNGGGRGGYSTGSLYLEKGTVLYLYTGASGNNGGFNGGGTSKSGDGGGASDIRIGSNSIYARVLVAGGGGGHGSDGCAAGAFGGGLNGGGSLSQGSCGISGGGGTSTEAGTGGSYRNNKGVRGTLAQGANALNTGGGYYGGGGGGGFYGGGSGATGGWSSGGGGGSGFVYTEETAPIVESINSADFYNKWLLDSRYYLSDAETIAGSQSMPNVAGTGTETGHAGNGYIKISIPYQPSENNFLSAIIADKGEMEPEEWDYSRVEYTLYLTPTQTHINLEAIPADRKAKVSGNGDYIIETGTTDIKFEVTSESGSVREYTLHVVRDADTNPYPRTIDVEGMLDVYCSADPDFCNYRFDQSETTYNIEVPYQIREINMSVDKAQYFQEVVGNGIYQLDGGINVARIDVTSEDKNNTASYQYFINRNMDGNADLKSLRIINPAMELNYSYNVTDYYITVPDDISEVAIEAIPDDENATYSISYPNELSYEHENPIVVTVRSADRKAIKIYTIYVTRLKSSNAFLSDLQVNNRTDGEDIPISLTPEFSKGILNYTIEVPNDLDTIAILANVENTEFSNAVITKGSEVIANASNIHLNVGANVYNITVTAQDGTTLVYKLTISRKANSNSALSNLYVVDHPFTDTFTQDKFVYYIYTTGEMEKAVVKATPLVETSTYKIISGNPDYLVHGKNEIIIRCTAEDNTYTDYVINIMRSGYSDNELINLTVASGNESFALTPNFDSGNEDYTLHLPNDITEILITAIANKDERAVIDDDHFYQHTLNLLQNNPYTETITVTAEDGEKKVYTINIDRELSDDNTLKSLTVDGIELSPEFNPETEVYNLETYKHSIDVSAIANNRFAKIDISSTNLTTVGINVIDIKVTSETGSEKTYRINATRVLNTEGYLDAIHVKTAFEEYHEINGLAEEYSYSTYSNYVIISGNVVGEYATGHIEYNGNNYSLGTRFNIEKGSHEFTLVATAENGDTVSHIVRVERLLENDSALTSLIVATGLDQTFSPTTFNYTSSTIEHTSSISYVLSGAYAHGKLFDNEHNEINQEDELTLAVGDNKYTIEVTAEDDTTTIYHINIIRSLEENNDIKYLEVSTGLDQEVDKDTLEYTKTTIAHKAMIVARPDGKFATFRIEDANGNEIQSGESFDLEPGDNVYYVIITAENDDVKTYQITLTRRKEDSNKLLSLEVSTGLNEKFSMSNTDYSSDTHEHEVTITAVTEGIYSTLSIETGEGVTVENGVPSPLKEGENEFFITVIPEDTNIESKEYYVLVTRTLDSNANVRSFTSSVGLDQVFTNDRTNYEATTTDKNISLNIIPESKYATVVVELDGSTILDPSDIVLTNGENIITVTVTSEDGNNEKVFTYVVTRNKESDNRLKDLITSEPITPAFNKDINTYSLDTHEKTFTLNAIKSGKYSEITITKDSVNILNDTAVNLAEGDNIFKIVVTPEDETAEEYTYTIVVNMSKEDDSSLKDIEITSGLDQDFAPTLTRYTKTTSLHTVTITGVPNGKFASVHIEDIDKNVYPNGTEFTLVNNSMNIYNIVVTSEDGNKTTTYRITLTKEYEKDNNLESVDFTPATLDQAFSSNRTTYTVTAHEADILFKAVPSGKYSTIVVKQGNGVEITNDSTIALQSGANNYTVEVIPEDQNTASKIYNFEINYVQDTDSSLKELYVSTGLDQTFSPENYSYTKELTRDKNVTINVTPSSKYAIVTIYKGTTIIPNNTEVSLDEGHNLFSVVIVAQDGTFSSYDIDINRVASGDNYLADLTSSVGHVNETVTTNKFDYTLDTSSHIVTIIPRLSSQYARYVITDTEGNILEDTVVLDKGAGAYKYIIKVIAENDSERSYNLTIYHSPGHTATISSLGITTTPTFNKDVFTYSATTDETSLDLSRLRLTDPNSTYQVFNNSGFEVGVPQAVMIKVIAEDGYTQNIYTINVTKNISTDARLKEINIGDYELTPAFDPGTVNYTAYISNSDTSINLDTRMLKNTGLITSIKLNNDELLSTPTYEYTNDISIPPFNDSTPRTLTITGQAEDGISTKIYTVELSSSEFKNNNLSNIIIKYTTLDEVEEFVTLAPEFNSDVLAYNVIVPLNTDFVTIEATADALTSTVSALQDQYRFEDNKTYFDVPITVTDKLGNNKTYMVRISRPLSSESRIKSISFVNEEITFDDFDPDTYEYHINVPNEYRIHSKDSVIIELMDRNERVNVESCNVDLNKDNVCRIITTAEDGSSSIYSLHLTREPSTVAKLLSLKVKGYEFESGDFDPDIYNYVVRLPREKIVLSKDDIEYSLEDNESTIQFPADLNINYSLNDNIYQITTIASDGVTKKYYIINVKNILDSNTGIDSIKMDIGTLPIPDVVNEAANPAINIDIFDTDESVLLEDITLKSIYSGHDMELPATIEFGKTYKITVAAENEDIKEYSLKLQRTKTRELGLNNIVPNFVNTDDCSGICTFTEAFASDKSEYTITIPNEKTSLDFTITPKNNLQRYEVLNNTNFDTGLNDVIIRVTNSLNETRDYTIHVIREPSSNAYLTNLSFTTPEKAFVFDKDTYEYNVEFSKLKSGVYDIDVELEDPNASYVIEGAQALYFGRNNITVHTRSESCTSEYISRKGCQEKFYTVHAYRYATYSNLLSSLTISSGDSGNLLQNFNKYDLDYVLEVSSEVINVKFETIPAAYDEITETYKARVEYRTTTSTPGVNNGEFALKLGVNTIYIDVIPETDEGDDGNPQTYTINIVRSTSDNVNLESLSVDNYTLSPAFAKNNLNYEVTVPNEVTSLSLHYVPEVSDSTVYVNGNKNFVTGDNIVSIVVLSADKTRGKTYNITVHKSQSTNNFLSNITAYSIVEGEVYNATITPEFIKTKESGYVINLPSDKNNIKFVVTKDDAASSVSGDGTHIVDYGRNEYNINVTAENGDIRTYSIVVNRAYNLDMANVTLKDYIGHDYLHDSNNTFNKSVRTYNIDVPHDVEEISIDGMVDEILSTVEGLGEFDLHTGINTLTVTVTYAGESDTYTFYVNRAASDNNNLADLYIEEGVLTPDFDKNTTTYTVSVPNDFTSITPHYETEEDTASVTILNNGGLEVGVPKNITVRVTSESGKVKDYVLIVTRTNKPASSNYLDDMYVDEAPIYPEFESRLLNYAVDVEKTTKLITLHIKSESPFAKVQVYKLGETAMSTLNMKKPDPSIMLDVNAGKNTFIIRVTNDDGLIRNYRLDVYKNGEAEARIKSLSFDHGTINGTFDKNKLNYTIEVPNEYTRITPEVVMMDPNATYTVVGNKKLKIGSNTVKIITLAQDGVTSLEYVFDVYREPNHDATLAAIATFPENEFEFDPEQFIYTLEIDKDVSTVQVIGVRNNMNSTITGNGIYQLEGDSLDVKLEVTAEDNTTKNTYTVHIVKKKDSNTNLANIIINNGELNPTFNKDTLDYTIELENWVDSINIKGIPESKLSIVSGNGNYNLKVGENKYVLTVKAENNTTKSYNIRVIRKAEDTINNYLKTLNVKEGELIPKFSPANNEYIVAIPNEYTEATITYTLFNDDATVTILNNRDFIVGSNLVYIDVEYEGNINTYTIEVIRQDASNTYLKSLSINGYTLTPEFDKTMQEYRLYLDQSVTRITTQALPEIESNKVYVKVEGGEYQAITNAKTLDIPSESTTIYYRVVSSSNNAERIYKINIEKSLSSENKLLTFATSVGTLDKEFDKDINNYTITVPVGTTTTNFSGTISTGATVSGLDTINIAIGNQTRLVTVTSQSGEINTYTFTIVRNADTNATITNIVPTSGTLSPTFQTEVSTYDLVVDGNITTISFNVTTASRLATVTGNKDIPLNPGNNKIAITSTAEDGVTKDVKVINIYRRKEITGFSVEEEIDVPIGDDQLIEITFMPKDTDYTGLTYSVADTSVLTINNGVIHPIKIGTTTVTITSTRNSNITKTITVNIIQPNIESDTYYIFRENEYITRMELGTTVATFISNLKNDPTQIHVYNKDGMELTESDVLSSYYVVKLELNGKTYDELTLIIKGDINGDGKISVVDMSDINSYLLGLSTFDLFKKAAADLNMDDKISVVDFSNLNSFLLLPAENDLNKDLDKYWLTR